MRPHAPPPRNYFAIPLAEGREHREEPVYHDRLESEEDGLRTGAVELEIETLTPVHVGCGAYGLDGEHLLKEPTRRAGALVIPGSSIKGMSRQIFEALTGSGSPFDRQERHRKNQNDLSPAAAVFGTLGLQGRISFDDAVPGGGDAPAEAPPERIRMSVGYPARKRLGRRFYGRLPRDARQPPTIPAHAIPAGTRLTTTLRFRNLSRRGLGGVLTSLGVGRFTPRLGGGKYDDFGWVRFHLTAYRLRPHGFGKGVVWERRPEHVRAFVEACQRELHLDADGEKALRTLEERLQYTGPPTVAKGGRE